MDFIEIINQKVKIKMLSNLVKAGIFLTALLISGIVAVFLAVVKIEHWSLTGAIFAVLIYLSVLLTFEFLLNEKDDGL